MKTFASVLQGVGLALVVFAAAVFSPILGVLCLGVELAVIGIALEAR